MPKLENPLERYQCGPVSIADHEDYDRRLFFDHVVSPDEASARERYEALARSIRDLLAQRWLLTRQTYNRTNPKQVYYLSMEFLIGRTMANTITNLQVEDYVREDLASDGIRDWQICSPRRSRTLGWATVASADWLPASSTRWPPSRFPRSATDCATNTACSARRSRTAGRSSTRTTGYVFPTPGK